MQLINQSSALCPSLVTILIFIHTSHPLILWPPFLSIFHYSFLGHFPVFDTTLTTNTKQLQIQVSTGIFLSMPKANIPAAMLLNTRRTCFLFLLGPVKCLIPALLLLMGQCNKYYIYKALLLCYNLLALFMSSGFFISTKKKSQ